MASSTKSNMRSKPMLDRHRGVKSIMVLIATFSSEQHGHEHGCRCAAPAKPDEWRLAQIQLGTPRSRVKTQLICRKAPWKSPLLCPDAFAAATAQCELTRRCAHTADRQRAAGMWGSTRIKPALSENRKRRAPAPPNVFRTSNPGDRQGRFSAALEALDSAP